MGTLNLGILAHVDAGKTTLTERLLYAAGVIDEIGNVDDGNTQTDSLALEQKRGITIKSAVVSFAIDGAKINLIDTPGHPDFIAEVERVLGVLDGAVLVISAVEGVQAQTRVLMRTLGRLGIPTLIFANKIDRSGARCESLLQNISERLTPEIIPMGSVVGLGTRDALCTPYGDGDPEFVYGLVELLADHDEALLAEYVDGEKVSYGRLRRELAAQTGRAVVHPVFFGSAVTGAGLEWLISGITDLLPVAEGDADGPVSGTVFKVERGSAGEKIAYLRVFSGTVRVRDRLRFRGGEEQKVTAINTFERGSSVRSTSVAAGQIGKLWGLGDVRIGDALGEPRTSSERHYFDPPTLETAIVPRRSGEKGSAQRARAACRPGPLDQPPPGRRQGRTLPLALRRGAKRGDRGHAGGRIRPGRRVSRDDDDLHRAARRHRRSRRTASRRTFAGNPVPRHHRAARRACRARFRGAVRA
jgi:ribosomal protection tetracycline resistance protein